MIITSKISEVITVEGAEGFNPVQITLRDEDPGKGYLVLQEGSRTNQAYFNNMGTHKLKNFLQSSTDSFIVGSLDPFGTLHRKIDQQVLREGLREELAVQLEAGKFDEEEFASLVLEVDKLVPVGDINALQVLGNGLLNIIYGPLWISQANELFLGKHEDFVALQKRVALMRTVISA